MNECGRRYTIQNDEILFNAGINRNNHQILIGIIFPEYIAIEFDPLGKYIAINRVPMASDAFDIVDGVYFGNKESIDIGLETFRSEVGFTPRTISVMKFFIDEMQIGIEDMPLYLQMHFDSIQNNSLETKDVELDNDLHEWISSGKFVLWWGNDYFLSADGEVESS